MSSEPQMEMQSNPLRHRHAKASDSDGSVHPEGVKVSMPLDKCVCGFVAAPVKSAWHSRWDFFKRNVPAIISICSVILNVVIISRLIPDMQSSISVMQGQAQTVQAQVNTINILLFGVNDKINDANIKIDTFNGLVSSVTQSLNTTETNIASFGAQAQADIDVIRSTAADILSSFRNSSVTLQQQVNASQTLADATLERAQLASAELDLKAVQYSTAANSSLQLLLQTNATVLSGVESVRTDFAQQTSSLSALTLQSFSIANASYFAALAESRVPCRVLSHQMARQPLIAGQTLLQWDTNVIDTDAIHPIGPASPNTTFYVQRDGFYRIWSTLIVRNAAVNGAIVQLQLRINGLYSAFTLHVSSSVEAAFALMNVQYQYLTKGDTIQWTVYCDNPGFSLDPWDAPNKLGQEANIEWLSF